MPSGDAGRQLLPRALSFLNTFNPSQIRYAATEYRDLLDFILQEAETESKVGKHCRGLGILGC